MKIGCIYTNTNGNLVKMVEESIKKEMNEEPVDFFIFSNPQVLKDVIKNDGVTAKTYKDMYKMYLDTIACDVDVVYNVCSSVGDVATFAQDTFSKMGVPLIKIDEYMANYAVSKYKKIGVIATLHTTMVPTQNQIQLSAKKIDKEIKVETVVVDAFGKNAKQYEEMLVSAANTISEKVEVIVLAQASMAVCESKISEKVGLETLSSPRFGAKALKEMLRL